jgi:hypothetical protein
MPNQKFIDMLEAFVAGTKRSREFVREIDEEFYACGLHEEDELHGLQLALDLFGVPKGQYGYDEAELSAECRGALVHLRKKPIQPPQTNSARLRLAPCLT